MSTKLVDMKIVPSDTLIALEFDIMKTWAGGGAGLWPALPAATLRV